MKNAIVKAVALCTLAVCLLLAGAVAVNTMDNGVAVCHDGPYDLDYEY